MSNGYTLHSDSERIIIATGFKRRSENPKTGDMLQVYILVRRSNPVAAVKSGRDSLVCGDCHLRGVKGKGFGGRTCYVNVGQAVNNVWRAWKRGTYPLLLDYGLFEGHKVRFGSYGEPTHIPYPTLEKVAHYSAGWTGYTHQWHNPLYQAYSKYLMASVESVDMAQQAHKLGWRTFRVTRTGGLTKGEGEIVCPNTTRGTQCADCRLCSGQHTEAKNIIIEAHGLGKKNLKGGLSARTLA